MRMHKLLLLVVVLIAGVAFSQQAVYFDVGMAKELGMGSAFTALTDDVNAIIWNPAVLGTLSQNQTSFSAAAKAKDAKVYMLTFGSAAKGAEEFTGALTYWNGRRDDTQEEETDIVYSVAQQLGSGFYLGANIRSKRGEIAGRGDNAWAIDIGFINKVDPQLTIGVAYLNANAPSFELPGGASPLLPVKPMLNIGFSYRPNGDTLCALDFFNITREKGNLPTDKVQIRGGLEIRINPYVVGRIGWLHKNGTIGLGVSYGVIRLDYGYLIARDEREDLHLLTLTSSF